jgi:hypothetical protein
MAGSSALADSQTTPGMIAGCLSTLVRRAREIVHPEGSHIGSHLARNADGAAAHDYVASLIGPNRVSSSDRGRPDRFKLDQHPWSTLDGAARL